MPRLDLHDLSRTPEAWARFTGDAAAVMHGQRLLLPLAEWLEFGGRWRAHGVDGGAQLGVLLGGADDPHRLQGTLEGIALIAVEFAAFGDGRGFSIGYMIRRDLGWRGPLRAVGELLPDQLGQLLRSGFDEAESDLLADREAAAATLCAFSVAYQPVYRFAA